MGSSSPEEQVGLLIWGSDPSRPIHFYAVAGFDLNEASLPVLSATGVPDEDDFPSLDPTHDPIGFREAITDTNVSLDRQNKQFYKDTVQQEFLQSFEKNLSRIRQILQSDSPRQSLEQFLPSVFSKFRAADITVELVEYDEILYEDDGDGSGSEPEEESEPEPSGIEVTPVIDVNDGIPVDSFSSGDPLLVKFTEDAIEEYNLSEEYQDVALRATVQEYRLGINEVEGTLIVTLQEGVTGVADVSTGSLIQVPSPLNDDHGEESVEQRVSFMMVATAVLLMLLAVVSFVVIF